MKKKYQAVNQVHHRFQRKIAFITDSFQHSQVDFRHRYKAIRESQIEGIFQVILVF